MSVVLTVFIILASLLMIGIVLVQKSKGGGLASNFASSNQIMGVRKTTDFVEKATWTLAIVIMVLSIATVFVSHNGQQSSVSEIKDIVNTEAPAALPGYLFESKIRSRSPIDIASRGKPIAEVRNGQRAAEELHDLFEEMLKRIAEKQ